MTKPRASRYTDLFGPVLVTAVVAMAQSWLGQDSPGDEPHAGRPVVTDARPDSHTP
jgi:hypothetical protein